MKIFIIILALSFLIPLLTYVALWLLLVIKPKFKVDKSLINIERIKISEDFYKLEDNWLKRNPYGLWELFITKNGFENGLINGKLCKELIDTQETYFIEEIKRIIPSNFYTFFLKIIVGWINRKIEHFIPKEYLLEIYGISLSASERYKYITLNYQRYLNYHAANDIGHAIEDLNMVACTSFSVWNKKSKDGSLLIGRNFDFYFGENFAQDKMICFYKPDNGYNFMMISWGGMVGAVSGMNMHGLTLTINTAKSNKPSKARTPLCIIGRKILQYASNIDEAYEIAKKTDTFISASFLIGSHKENKSVIIEKSITKTCLFDNIDENFISCTNHFQSQAFSDDALNKDNIENGYSIHRLNRTNELINKYDKIGVNEIASILRNQKGINDIDIGIGNEKAINQLSAHHSIIFKPSELKVWISTKKYQMGEYICYDLNKVYSSNFNVEQNPEIYTKELTIAADSFLNTGEIEKYNKYREQENKIEAITKKKTKMVLQEVEIASFISLNPSLFKSYLTIGNYYYSIKDFNKAKENYNIAITKEVASERERKSIISKITNCEKKSPVAR